MRQIAKLRVIAVMAAALLLLVPGVAHAQSIRTFVSGLGSDSGNCGRAAPCRTFAYAITQTASQGEIAVLDTAGYGAVTISQSVAITNPGGVEAGITAPADETAITITSASIVTLRGLTLRGAGLAANGILLSAAGGTLSIIDCVVEGFASSGIYVQPSGMGTTNLVIASSFSLNNGGDGITIFSDSSQTNINFSIIQTVSSTNNNGIAVEATPGTLNGVIVDSVLNQNVNFGLVNVSDIEEGLLVNHSKLLFNQNSDISNDTGIIFLYGSNTIGKIASNNTIFTDGTNNIVSHTGSLTKISPQ